MSSRPALYMIKTMSTHWRYRLPAFLILALLVMTASKHVASKWAYGLFEKARSHFIAGRYDEASELLKKCISRFPSEPEYLAMLADTYYARDSQIQGDHLVGRIERIDRNSPFYKKFLARRLLLEGKFVQALDIYGQILKSLPGDLETRFETALARLQSGAVGKAETLLSETLKESPDFTRALMLMARIQGDKGNRKEEFNFYNRVMAVNRDLPRLYFEMGCACLRWGQFQRAAAFFGTCLDREPENIPARFNLGLCHQNLGKYEAAAREFQVVARTDPANVDAILNLGLAYGVLGNRSEETRCYRNVLKISPENPLALYNLGCMAHGRRDAVEALDLFEKALRSRPDFTQACLNLALLHHEAGSTDKAAGFYQRVLELEPGNPQAHESLGRLKSSAMAGNLPVIESRSLTNTDISTGVSK